MLLHPRPGRPAGAHRGRPTRAASARRSDPGTIVRRAIGVVHYDEPFRRPRSVRFVERTTPFMNRSPFALRRGALSPVSCPALVAAARGAMRSSAVARGAAAARSPSSTACRHLGRRSGVRRERHPGTGRRGLHRVPSRTTTRCRTTQRSTRPEGGEAIAIGDIINEGEIDEIEVPALEPGTYFFVCDVHPVEMTGHVVVEG